jgi:hypothetical protein
MAENYIGNAPGAGLVVASDPIGQIGWFHAVPDASWVRLNGQSLAKASYPDLWVLAQSFLTTDQVVNPGLYRSIDANFFAVPKLDGLFIRAAGQYDATRVAGALGVFQLDQMQDHTHSALRNNIGQITLGGTVGGDSGGSGGVQSPGRAGNETRGANVALIPCVKALKTMLVPGAVALPLPAMQLLADKTAATVASLDFTNLVGYAAYKFVLLSVVPVTNGEHLAVRFSADNGVSFNAAVEYTYGASGWHSGGLTNAYASAGGTSFPIANGVGNNAGYGANGEVLTNDLTRPAGAAIFVSWQTALRNSGSAIAVANGSGAFTAAIGQINAIRFLFTAGNISTGRILCYGLRGA